MAETVVVKERGTTPAPVRPLIVDGIDLGELYKFLRALRDSGQVNMFGSAPYLEEMYGLGKADARMVLSWWMEDFR